jgi:hypothetical protein
MSLRTLALAASAVFVLAVPAWAHHSHANYLTEEPFRSLAGTIKEIQWINPHTWIYLEVKNDKGEVDVWALEGTSVTVLARRGWNRNNIKAGDKISVRCYPLRDGSNGCLLGFVKPEGGEEKTFD